MIKIVELIYSILFKILPKFYPFNKIHIKINKIYLKFLLKQINKIIKNNQKHLFLPAFLLNYSYFLLIFYLKSIKIHI